METSFTIFEKDFFIHVTSASMKSRKYALNCINSPVTHKIPSFSLFLLISFFLIASNLFCLSFSFLTYFFAHSFYAKPIFFLSKNYSEITSLYTSIFEKF